MARGSVMSVAPEPAPDWSCELRLGDLAHGAVERSLVADPDARARLADGLGLDRLDSLTADIAIAPWLDGAVIEGRWAANIEQTCGVTLEPFATALEGVFTVRVLPRGSVHAQEEAGGEVIVDPGAEDPPDLIDRDRVDLAAYVVEHLALEIDPFPRSPGAEFVARPEETPPSPFAVLRQLKPRPEDD